MANQVDTQQFSLSTAPAGRDERRFALALVLASAVVFCAVAPFATRPLGRVDAFIPIYGSALVLLDLITAVLLFGQASVMGTVALWVLASGYRQRLPRRLGASISAVAGPELASNVSGNCLEWAPHRAIKSRTWMMQVRACPVGATTVFLTTSRTSRAVVRSRRGDAKGQKRPRNTIRMATKWHQRQPGLSLCSRESRALASNGL